MEGCYGLAWRKKGLARGPDIVVIALADFYEAKRRLKRSSYQLDRLDADDLETGGMLQGVMRDKVNTWMQKKVNLRKVQDRKTKTVKKSGTRIGRSAIVHLR